MILYGLHLIFSMNRNQKSSIVAVEPRDIHNQFDLAASDRKHLEDPQLVTEPNDAVRSAARTLQRVWMNISIEDRFVQKTTFLYCTPGTPNV